MNRLKDKRTLITGGTSGIGLETARQFLLEGAQRGSDGHQPGNHRDSKATLGNDVLVIKSDAGSVVDQKGLADKVRAELGGLDVLFINAGVGDFRAGREVG